MYEDIVALVVGHDKAEALVGAPLCDCVVFVSLASANLFIFRYDDFDVLTLGALKGSLVVTGLVRFDARQHHPITAFRAG